jgi:hypothetical protein
MGMSRSAYYDYVRRTGNQFDDSYHEEMLGMIQGIAKDSIDMVN